MHIIFYSETTFKINFNQLTLTLNPQKMYLTFVNCTFQKG
jgi:hypothetical protein